MGEAQDLQTQIHAEEAKEANSPENADISHRSRVPQLRDYTWWLRMAIYTLSLLSGQSVALLLGRLYFDKGGKSKWMATLVQTAGFPVLLPFYISPTKNKPTNNDHTKPPSALTLASLYVFLGVFLVAVAMLYSIGLLNLPVSTFSLICASQLGFNALFSYFLNSQKFTPFIVNSLVLLTISSTLLVFQNDSSGSTKISEGKYLIGFLCTVGASAGYALMISLTQLSYQKILKSENFGVVLDMIIYQSLVATGAILVGLFASREWKGLKEEMGEFELGKVSYIMTLVWEAISWQVFSVGAVGLIFEVSSLFSNVITTLGLPIVPVLAVFVFHDKMDGVKVIAMLLAIWGFVSYIYQHYLDDLNSKAKTRSENGNGASEVSLIERDLAGNMKIQSKRMRKQILRARSEESEQARPPHVRPSFTARAAHHRSCGPHGHSSGPPRDACTEFLVCFAPNKRQKNSKNEDSKINSEKREARVPKEGIFYQSLKDTSMGFLHHLLSLSTLP